MGGISLRKTGGYHRRKVGSSCKILRGRNICNNCWLSLIIFDELQQADQSPQLWEGKKLVQSHVAGRKCSMARHGATSTPKWKWPVWMWKTLLSALTLMNWRSDICPRFSKWHEFPRLLWREWIRCIWLRRRAQDVWGSWSKFRTDIHEMPRKERYSLLLNPILTSKGYALVRPNHPH